MDIEIRKQLEQLEYIKDKLEYIEYDEALGCYIEKQDGLPTGVAAWANGAFYGFEQAAKAHEAEKLKGCVVVSEWISTRDYLPEEGVEVLVHRYGQIIQATKDKGYAGGFKERNCYGWQATFDVSYWMPKNFKLPDSYSFYYNDEHPYRETMLEEARSQS